MDGYQIKEDLLVPASEGIATFVEKGDCLEIIDVEGKQVGDIKQEEVRTPGNIGKAINTIGIVAHLTKAVQELSTKNDALETRIVALES